jgi:hypothetical protein
MKASERHDLLKLILAKYLHGDMDLFHDLMESGPELVEELSAHFNERQSQDAKILAIHLAREIPTKESAELLVRAAFSEKKPIWKAALEALAYKQTEDVVVRLQELMRSAAETGHDEKQEYISDLLRTASEWIVRRDANEGGK